jgi:formylglycine-generating enzyme required for sulfatase activity
VTLPISLVAILQPLADKTEPCSGEVVTVPLGQGVEMKFAWVPPGVFLMGSPPDEAMRNDDEKRHRVALSRGVYLAIHPVTQAQWQAVVGDNPSRFKSGDRPVETVSWFDCVDFCKRLGQQTAKRFRLPTEAEWEYACRAGAGTVYHRGNDLEALRRVGWCSYDGNQGSARETRPVRLFPPNALGLFDMHGNVWEWCSDWYGHYKDDDKDPSGPTTGSARVLRGGSWYYGPEFCRCARRVRMEPGCRYIDFGCRVVLCPS